MSLVNTSEIGIFSSEPHSEVDGSDGIEVYNPSGENNSLIEDKPLDEILSDAQTRVLSQKEKVTVVATMSVGFFISFVDQTGITVALPYIARDLHAERTISWAGTASLLANTVFQVLYGRLSDIFGRKNVIIVCLLLLSIGDLACGFAKTDVQFFIFRALAGIGNGGISSLTNVIVSDVVTLEERGKFQGILGSMSGFGNSIGPFLASAFVLHSTWRGYFWMLCPIVIITTGIIFKLVPNNKSPISKTERLKSIDYLGFLLSTAGLTLILVPLNGGGVTISWTSPKTIVMFVVGGICLISFWVVEWKHAKLPMIPLRLLARPPLVALLFANFCFGIVYYTIFYYIPYYFEVVKGYDILKTSCFVLPIVMMQGLFSIIAGNIISKMGHYIYVIQFGMASWLLGVGLTLIFDAHTHAAVNAVVLLFVGAGAGCVFQPMLIAVQAQAKKADRAVVISTRNVFRSLGGSIGIAISGLILGNRLLSEIEKERHNLPAWFIVKVEGNLYGKIDTTGLDSASKEIFEKLYMRCLKSIFYMWVPCMAICLLICIFIKDNGLQSLDMPPKNKIEEKENKV